MPRSTLRPAKGIPLADPATSNPAPSIPGTPVDTVTCECGTVVKVKGMPPLSTVACPKCNRQFPVPFRMGQFLVLRLLGKGAMGEVFEAKDTTLGRRVAVKMLGKKVSASEETMRSFVQEARNLAALNHRNVVQVHTIGVEKGHPYIVMELVSGGRVDQMIQKDTPGDERRLLQIAVDVARGLDAAWKAGLVHGDVKPANILLDQQGQGKIVDFGLARFAESDIEGKIYGTPYYLPPELLEGKAPDFRSDMYSMGASFFHAFTGRPPFRAKTVKDIVRMRLIEPAPDLRTLAPDVHRRTAAVFARILQKDPDQRYSSYDALVADLQRALEGLDQPDSDDDLAELTDAMQTDIVAGRSSRGPRHAVHTPEPGARSRSFSRTHHGRGIAPPGGKRGIGVFVIVGVVLFVVAIGVLIATGAFKGKGGAGATAEQRSFTDGFDGAVLDPAWQPLAGGGAIGKGILKISDRDAAREPGIQRTIGPGSYSATIAVSKFEWAGSGEVFKVEVEATRSRELLLHLYNDQGNCTLEAKIRSDGVPKLLGKTRFDAPPKALNLRIEWSAEEWAWRVYYGIDGQPASTKVEGGFHSPDDRSAADKRVLRIVVDQYASAGTTVAEIDEVSVKFAE